MSYILHAHNFKQKRVDLKKQQTNMHFWNTIALILEFWSKFE